MAGLFEISQNMLVVYDQQKWHSSQNAIKFWTKPWMLINPTLPLSTVELWGPTNNPWTMTASDVGLVAAKLPATQIIVVPLCATDFTYCW